MTLATAPVIETRDLHVTRGEKRVLRGLSVSARPGEVVGVLGPSGAGKSTFFRALVGEIPVDSGDVFLEGRAITKEPLWRRARAGVSYVSQTPSVFWDLTVHENLRVYHRVVYGRARFWWRATAASKRAEEHATTQMAERVALTNRLNVRAGELSGGERRRLEIGRALTRAPKVLVCDEPFAGVDPRQAGHLGDLLRTLADDHGVCVLLSDHHVAEALRVCTRALLFLDGEIAMQGDPRAFENDTLVRDRYLLATRTT